MNIKILKWLDKYVGFCGCVLVTFISKLAKSKKINIDEININKILFVKFWGLGSILLLSPAVQEFKNKYPKSKVVFLTLKRNEEISKSLNLFDEVRSVDVDAGWLAYIISMVKIIIYFWKSRFDMVVDFEFFTRFSSIVTFLTFAPVRVGYHSWSIWRGDVHNFKVPFNRYWHIIDNFYNLAKVVGLEKGSNLKVIKPVILEEDKRFVEGLLKDNGISKDYIVMHVNSSDLSLERRWPYENFVNLIKKINEKYELPIVFIGSGQEKNAMDILQNKIAVQNVFNFAGKLNITQLSYLLQRARLMIANDSGPLHLAVAMDTPTISFFGPETPVIYGPIGKKHKVFYKNLDCSPCMNVHERKSVHCYWKSPKCMEEIKVEEVFEAIEEELCHKTQAASS